MLKRRRRSHRCIYLGLSKNHSSNKYLVLNSNTEQILPQYHLIFDNSFSTVESDGEFDTDAWSSLVNSYLKKHIDTDNMLLTFKIKTPSTPHSIPQFPPIPVLQITPAIPELLSIPELPPVPSLSDAIASFHLPFLTEGVSSQAEGDTLFPEGDSLSLERNLLLATLPSFEC